MPFLYIKEQILKYNFSTKSGSSDNSTDRSYPNNLENLKVSQLKELAKKHNISLRSKMKKADIQRAIKDYFLAKNTTSDIAAVVPIKFPIESDSKNRINISLWFRQDRREVGYNRLKRFLKSWDVVRLVNETCRQENLTESDVIHYEGGSIYAMQVVAILTASKLSTPLLYNILRYFLVSRPEEIKKLVYRKAVELLEEIGIKVNLHVRWDTLEIPFAYYLIVIDNVVESGVIGVEETSKGENLNLRLGAHRLTHADFTLLNVFSFQDLETVQIFAQAVQHLLSPYSIGNVEKYNMERYKCPGKNTSKVVNHLVSNQFSDMNFEDRQLGMECPVERIHSYNGTGLEWVSDLVGFDIENNNKPVR